MSQYCRRPAWFAFYDRVRIEQKLEQMSEKGWIIQKMGGYFWRYEKAEPKKRHVTVTYVADASEFNAAPTLGQQELEELAAQDGWELKAAWGQMQIYYHEQEDPAPMETDPVTQVETIHRAMKKNGIPGSLVNLLMSFVWIGLFCYDLIQNPAEFLSTPFKLLLLPDALLMLLAALIEIIYTRQWYGKARKAAENGVYLDLGRHKVLTWILNTLCYGILLLMLFSFGDRWRMLGIGIITMLLAIGVGSLIIKGIMKILKPRHFSKQVNLILSTALCGLVVFFMITGTVFTALHLGLMEENKSVGTYVKYGLERKVYAEELPLQLQDLQETGEMQYSREKRGSESIFVSHYNYRQWPLTEDAAFNDLEYEVTEVKQPFVYDLCKWGILKSKDETDHGEVVFTDHYEAIDPASWQADEAYQLHWSDSVLNRYVLCYGNKIVQLNLDETPTAEQKQTVAEIFGS